MILQAIIESASASADSDSLPFYNAVGNNKVTIRKGVLQDATCHVEILMDIMGDLNTVGNLSYYGQYADDSTFEVIPVWQNKAQAMAFEDAIWTPEPLTFLTRLKTIS